MQLGRLAQTNPQLGLVTADRDATDQWLGKLDALFTADNDVENRVALRAEITTLLGARTPMEYSRAAGAVRTGTSSAYAASKRLGSPYRSGRSPHWVKIKNPNAPAVKRDCPPDPRANCFSVLAAPQRMTSWRLDNQRRMADRRFAPLWSRECQAGSPNWILAGLKRFETQEAAGGRPLFYELNGQGFGGWGGRSTCP
jgi:hypothetical protein